MRRAKSLPMHTQEEGEEEGSLPSLLAILPFVG